jgi:hypothetical protein
MIFWLVLKLEINYRVIASVFFFGANFRNLVTKKKKELANPTKVFLRFKKKSPYLDQKNLEVVRFRQCVHVCRQN